MNRRGFLGSLLAGAAVLVGRKTKPPDSFAFLEDEPDLYEAEAAEDYMFRAREFGPVAADLAKADGQGAGTTFGYRVDHHVDDDGVLWEGWYSWTVDPPASPGDTAGDRL